MKTMNTDLYELAKQRGIMDRVKSVAEVGVNAPDKCSFIKFFESGLDPSNALLVEPLPWLAEELRLKWPAARVVEAAIGPRTGVTKLYDRGEGSWIDEVKQSPDEHKGTTRTSIAETEDGRFVREVAVLGPDCFHIEADIVAIDTEGAEIYALHCVEKARYLPALLRIETHSPWGYVNPHMEEINEWVKKHGYRKLFSDASDTFYCLNVTLEARNE